MARLTLDQINQMTPDIATYLQTLGYTVGENEDGSPRLMDSDGNWVAPDVANDILSGDQIAGYGADARRMQGIIDLADYSNPASIAEYAKKGLGNTPEAYLSQLYGGGERVGDYFVLPQEQDVRSAQMVGTPIVYNSPGLFKEFLTNGALLLGAGYGLNALTTGGFGGLGGAGAAEAGATAGADAAWGVNAAGSGAGTAAGEFGLSGATAGNLAGTGGLSSTAGLGLGANAGTGALGLGSGAAGAAAMGAGSGALLTPALAGAAGIGAGAYGLGAGGSGLTAAQAMGGVGGAGTAATGAGAITSGAGTAIGRIFDGTATAGDWAQVLGGAGSALLGVQGANAQGDAYSDVADKYLALGAPYRNLLTQSYSPGFSMADQPDFQNALDVGAQAAARATSAKVGNPVDNPGAYAEMQKYITGSLALPQLNTYRSQLGSFGQLGTNTAGTGDMNAAGQTSGAYNALGYGLGQITQPQSVLGGNNGALARLLLNSGQFL